jgi:hypothetical protein
MFTPQQEVDLGDIQAQRIERDVRVIHDDELSAYLNRLAQRLLGKMPATGLQFRVTLIDLPVVNRRAGRIAGPRDGACADASGGDRRHAMVARCAWRHVGRGP